MAAHASKRRKLEHVITDEASDGASFASLDSNDGSDHELQNGQFRDSEDTDSANETETDGSKDDEDLEDEQDGYDEDMGEGDVAKGVSKPLDRNLKNAATNGPSQRGASARAPQNSAYSAGTFKSSLFKLQVDELLEEIRPRHGKREVEAEAALHRIRQAIDGTPSREPLPVYEAEKELVTSSNVVVPFPYPRPPKDAKYKLSYRKPGAVNIVGSYALKTASRARKTLDIDMVIIMPSTLFQEKDYLNYRYFYKRAYYLACLAAGLQEAGFADFHIRFANAQNNPLKPIIEVVPEPPSSTSSKDGSVPKWRINIIPGIAENAFGADKLLPSRNCVRHQDSSTAVDDSTKNAATATPLYNSSLRSDMVLTNYLKLMHSASKRCSAFQDACLLGRTWLRQRVLHSSLHSGGFGPFEWSAVMALLLEGGGPAGKPIISDRYSSYQMFKATLQILAMRDLCKQPITTKAESAIPTQPEAEAPVFWDALQQHNVLYKMTPWSYKSLRQEARTSLQMLAETKLDSFEACFIMNLDNILSRYDHVVQLDESTVRKASTTDDHLALSNYKKLYKTLQRGLGDRLNHLNIVSRPFEAWTLGSPRPEAGSNQQLLVELNVNSETVGRSVDHGPSAEQKDRAAAFRHFWGDKAELRRFKDGSILEALVWDGKEAGMPVFEQIIRYLLTRHFGQRAEQSARIYGHSFNKRLSESSGRAAFSIMMDGFQQLEADVRSLDGLPLSMRQLSPADPQLRYASTDLPTRARRRMPADVVLQFEGSTRWPDDLVAIQRTKIAFLLKLSEQVHEFNNSITARLGLENEDQEVLNQAFLDVAYDSGAAFRIRIHHDREQTLLERRLKDKTIAPSTRDTAILGLATYKRVYLKAPAHTQALAGLCSRHPALSGTVRLLKQWCAAHLISNQIEDEVIELIAARTFVHPWPWQVPSSVATGFYRTLNWLSRWDWRNEPLIVDLSGGNDLKDDQYQSIVMKFEAWRKVDPAMNRVVLFAASNVDYEGTTWTDGQPAKVVAGRISALAKAARAEIEEKQLELDPTSLFSSPLSDFDFVLHLNSELVCGRSKRKRTAKGDAGFKNLEVDFMDNPGTVGFDPLHDLLTDLQRLYGSAMLLFSGGNERPVIAGLWNPQTAPRAWTLNLSYSTVPVIVPDKEKSQAQVNKEAVLAEIANLAGEMITRVEVYNR
jgi:U3 small nucleolar RNA-associated protein 22